MTTATNVLSPAPEGPGLFARFGGFLRDYGAIVRAASEADRLFGYSDSELARRRLERSEIVPQVFGRCLDRR